jgi:hypothetical protein
MSLGKIAQNVVEPIFLSKLIHNFFHEKSSPKLPWRRGVVLTSPPATEEIGAMGREIESLQGIGW